MHYSELVECYENLEKTSSRLEKTKILSTFLAKAREKELLLLQGKVFPSWNTTELGVSTQLVLKAMTLAFGIEQTKIEQQWKQTGDLGLVAEQMNTIKKQQSLFSEKLTTEKVFNNLRQISTAEGQGTVDRKVKLLSELLLNASSKEAKYITRTALGDLRIGLGESTLRDALVWALFGNELELKYENNEFIVPNREKYNEINAKVQNALDITGDISEVATIAKKGITALEQVTLIPGRPCKAMLFQKAKNIKDAFEQLGPKTAVEYKYDGFRVLIHKNNNGITIYTRKLENVTLQFPDLVEETKKSIHAETYIIDCEAVCVKNGKYIPFQDISQRIKRKHKINEMAKEYPVELRVFDLLYCNGKSTIEQPFIERRKQLEQITDQKIVAEEIITDSEDEATRFYEQSLAAGNEGVMVKNLESKYQPGARVGFGLKVKPVLDNLDVVVVGAEWGEGKRSNWLSSFTIAVQEENGELLEIGNVGTGIKEKDEEGTSFGIITEMLKPNIISEEGRKVKLKPLLIFEVSFEEVQASPSYSSGYALRFPRFIRLREEKSIDEISTIEDLMEIYKMQRGRNS